MSAISPIEIPHHGAGHCSSRRAWIFARILRALAVSSLVAGCAEVHVRQNPAFNMYAEREAALPIKGRLSTDANETLGVLGLDEKKCAAVFMHCVEAVRTSNELDQERRLAVLTELWKQAADKAGGTDGRAESDACFNALLESARSAYSYLFLTRRSPGERAFEERQTRVLWMYTDATGRIAVALFARRRNASMRTPETAIVARAGWSLVTDLTQLHTTEAGEVEQLVASPSLGFRGIRSTYGRDGLGARFVAVMKAPPYHTQTPFEATRFRPVTVMLRFPGQTLSEMMNAHQNAVIQVLDPYHAEYVRVGAADYPLAADFTAAYGLWLARSDFSRESVRSLFGRDGGPTGPVVIMMQPYDPQRRTIILLHGLVGSPEAWVNVANEIMGDRRLRDAYQIWQVYYPTNLPVAYSRRAIELAIRATFAAMDPQGTAPASHDAVLIGHSMGGVIARLLVTSSGEKVWRALWPDLLAKNPGYAALDSEISPYLHFEPLTQIGRAIFIATPHRGTPLAGHWLERAVSRLIAEPSAFLQQVQETINALARIDYAQPSKLPALNSVQSLSDANAFILATRDLPISLHVPYHSIIAQSDPRVALGESNDGFVPYTSSHLDGAESERVIVSSHRVQETPAAILELRRILREHLSVATDRNVP